MPSFADAIEPQIDSGGAISFQMLDLIEEAGQTYLYGMPVQVNGTDGGVQIWDGSTLTAGIAGFALQNAQNLGTTGAGAAQPFSPILGPGSNVGNFAANSTQSLAVVTPPMTPMSTGLAKFAVAGPNTLFMGKLGTSATVTPVATTNQQVGVAYGLSKDTGNSFWFVDTNKTGASAAVRIVALYPGEAVGTVGGHVIFQVLQAVAQIVS
jgi:hypothetical protein